MALIQRLLDDHVFFRQYLDRLNDAGRTLPPEATISASLISAEEFTVRLRRHARIENEILFPALQRTGNEGDRIKHVATFLAHGTDEHASVAKRHAELNAAAGEQTKDNNWRKFLGKFTDGLLTHMAKEEDEIFPLAQALLGDDLLAELNQKANNVQ